MSGGLQYPRFLQQLRRNADRLGQLLQELDNDVSPSVLSVAEVNGLARLLGCLMGSKTRPFVVARIFRVPGVLQVMFRLPQPVLRSITHSPSLKGQRHDFTDGSGIQPCPMRLSNTVNQPFFLVGRSRA
jgi:hypothetical protein